MGTPLLPTSVEPLPGRFTSGRWIAWLALVLSLAFTLLSWRYAADSADREAELRFDAVAADVHDAIRIRMAAYEQSLRGGVALFAASASVERQEWKRYVEAAHVEQRFPGIQGMSFAPLVSARAREAHIRAMRAEGYPDYTIRPEGERPEYTPVVYIEPFSGRNLRAFGYDIFSEPVRRAALERARDTGEAAVTAKLALVQETERDHQAGFLMCLPVYRNGAPQASVAERRAAFAGYVTGVFRVDDLMQGILNRGARAAPLNLEIYDGTEVLPAARLYGDGWHDADSPRFMRDLALETGGRTWTLRVSSTREFETQVATRHPQLMLIGGMALSVLVLLLSYSLLVLQKRTRRIVTGEAALRQSRERLKSALAAGHLAVWEEDAVSGKVWLSEQWAELLGEAPRETWTSVEELVALTHPDDRQRMVDAIVAVMKGERPEFSEEHRVRSVSGEWRWFRAQGQVTARAADGRAARLSGTNLDITEHKRAQEALNQASETLARQYHQIEEANRAKTDFMSNVTHELRTPLNAVLGFAGLLKDGVAGPLNAQQAEFVADILAGGQRLLTLVEGILAMSRLDVAGTAVEREPVALGAALAERVAAHRQAAAARGVTMTLQVTPEAGSAELNPQALRRMLDALLDNAIKFNREGGSVAVSARREGGWLEMVVADTGIGMARADLAKLFQPLVQLDSDLARTYDGIGLGLTLAQRLAELHGGTLKVDSELGQGSTFTLRLPIKEKS